jgi:hypothetical protein
VKILAPDLRDSVLAAREALRLLGLRRVDEGEVVGGMSRKAELLGPADDDACEPIQRSKFTLRHHRQAVFGRFLSAVGRDPLSMPPPIGLRRFVFR